MYIMYRSNNKPSYPVMLMTRTFRARKRHGADSLDLTIPAELVRKLEISDGDVFKLELEEDENIKLTYKRVYNSEE